MPPMSLRPNLSRTPQFDGFLRFGRRHRGFSAIASFAGVDKGIRRLSKFDMLLALLFLVFTDSDLQ